MFFDRLMKNNSGGRSSKILIFGNFHFYKCKYLKNPALEIIKVAGAGFEPCDLRVMGPARTPGFSTPLY
jgi:hypothetical protein